MRSMTLRSPLAVYVAALVIGAPAWAQDDPAAVLFREGREAAKRGDFATACPKFQASFATAAKVGTLFNLADCQYQTA